nr:immunoglobulin light chain junction region [Macaca mulatta]MOW12208.1 immunoglobulin light chain junction region [Macaca mulatta]NSL98913.1 immunoglobulin light chain junction region [Mus musculus]
CLQGYSTPYTF